MELPLCSFDLRSGIFCPRCQEKLRKGIYDELDIKVMKLLLELEKKLPKLQKAGYVKTVDGKETILVVLKEGGLRGFEVDELGRLRRRLSEELQKHVKVVEVSQDLIRFIEGVVAPARIMAVNKIWLPDGSEEMRIILDDRRSLKVGINSLIQVVGKVKGVRLRVDFERRWRRGGQRPYRGKAAAKDAFVSGHHAR